MMATSMGPNFTGHPAGMGHPGVAGHPMAPGMPHNPGQQGAPGGGMPHQFAGPMGVSAPGGQVNPAMMGGGMPPGANPNNPIQHLNPAQQHLYQQQQLQNQSTCIQIITLPLAPITHPSAFANDIHLNSGYAATTSNPTSTTSTTSASRTTGFFDEHARRRQRDAHGDAAQSAQPPADTSVEASW